MLPVPVKYRPMAARASISALIMRWRSALVLVTLGSFWPPPMGGRIRGWPTRERLARAIVQDLGRTRGSRDATRMWLPG